MASGSIPFLFPLLLLFFVPSFQDFYDTGRWVAMIIVTLYILILSCIRCVKTKKIQLTASPLSLGFGALTIASAVSIFTASVNKVEALVHPLGVMTYVCLFLLTLLLPNLLSKEQKNQMVWTGIVLTGCLGLIIVYQQFSITSMLFPSATFLQNTLWNPTGTPISAILLFGLGIPLVIQNIRFSFLHHKDKLAALGIVSGVFMCVGLGIVLWRFIPMIPTVIMPLSVGWTTMLEALKSGKTALVGVGAENFLAAYATGRPIAINQTVLWNTGFSTSATLLFHITTTLGILGLAAGMMLLIGWLRMLPKTVEGKIIWGAATLFIVVFPPSIPLLLFMTLLSVTQHPAKEAEQPIHKTLALSMTVCSIVLAAASVVGLYHFVKGELLYAAAGRAVETENNLTKAYTDHVLAIKQNQYMTRYHVSLSQLALVMGGSILASAPKNDATGEVTLLDEDKSLVTSLFSLAVSEAKLATALAPNNYVTWTNLATVYQSLTGVADDAHTWSIAAYQKALTLNPISPNLRIDFGGMYMQGKDYENAIAQFSAAATLKPNYANAYYNLANAFKTKGDIQSAVAALEKTLTLLPAGNTEYVKVQEEINTLKQQIPNKQTAEPTPTGQPKTTPAPDVQPLIP